MKKVTDDKFIYDLQAYSFARLHLNSALPSSLINLILLPWKIQIIV